MGNGNTESRLKSTNLSRRTGKRLPYQTEKMIGRTFLRSVSSLAKPMPKTGKGAYPVPNTPGYQRFMDLQSKFCAADGKLVWQKMGTDMALYYTAVGGCIMATVWSFYYFNKMASPPKNG